jgi:WD40 repeat protein
VEFDAQLVQQSLSFLASSRNGLSQRELEEITLYNDRTDTEYGTVAGGLFVILRQIRPYTQYRGEMLDFFHRNFHQAVQQRYLNTPEVWHASNAGLAAYFRGKADPDGDGSWSGSYPRGLSELPYHLDQGDEGKSLGQVLVDFGFLQEKILEFGPQTLIEDFNLFLNGWAKTNPKLTTALEYLREALRLSINQLASDPRQFLSQLWGRLFTEEDPFLRTLLQSFTAKATTPWVRLLSQSLTGSGPLLWHIEVYSTKSKYGRPKISLAPDGSKIIVARGDGSLSIFSQDSARPLIELYGDSNAGPVLDAVATDDGRKVKALRSDGSVNVWNILDQTLESTQKSIKHSLLKGKVHALATDGDLLMVGTGSGSVELYRLSDPSSPRRLESHEAKVCALAFSPSAHRAAAAYEDGVIKIWNLQVGRTISPDLATARKVLNIGEKDWESHGFGESPPNALAIAGNDQRLYVGHAEKIFSNLAGSSSFASMDIRGILGKWDIGDGSNLSNLEAYTDSPVDDLEVTPDERFAVTLSRSGTLKLWNLTRTEQALRLDHHGESDPIVAVTPDASRVLSIADDGFLLVWELTTGKLHRLRGHRDIAFDLRVSTDNRYAIVVSSSYCQVWDLKRRLMGEILGEIDQSSDFDIPNVWIRSVVPLQTGDEALIVTSDGTITTWNLLTGEPEPEPAKLPDNVYSAAAGPAGRWLLYSPDGHSLILRDLEGKANHRQYHFETPGSRVRQLYPFSDDGRFYVTSYDGRNWGSRLH